jgi:hypothetical protein
MLWVGPLGTKQSQVEFTTEEVRYIRSVYVGRKEAMSSPNVIELANQFGVSQETIRKIAKGRTYKWVKNV